jgi:uncharacterized protein YbdZ (MbtH family)
MARIFGIETARLIACDARWVGEDWQRGDAFSFLYRSRRGKFFLLTDVESWKILTEADARAEWAKLPEKLVSAEEAFKAAEIAPVPRSRDEEEDTRAYKVVCNDQWEFSIWLDYKELPRGWHFVGVSGEQYECLEFIEQNCVFGATNPGLP